MKALLTLLALAITLLPIHAQETPPPEAKARVESILNKLSYRSGTIALKGDLATMTLPEDFRYLGPDDAVTVLTDLWGNPPRQEKPLGLLVPKGFSPIERGSWAVIITYEEDGHVDDKDAGSTDFNALLTQMQKSIREGNKERVKEGYEAIDLVGWAEQPRYESATHKMYWAKELKFGDEPMNTLNYNIRMLGRRGVLVLNAVAGMDQLKEIQTATPQILKMVDFNPGQRYADFKPGSDKAAEYGVAALVLGGVAAKTGLLKTLWIGVLAFKKFIIIGLVGLGVTLKRLFKKNQ